MIPELRALLLITVGPLLLWVPILWLIGHISGWSTLAQHYRATAPLPAPTHRFSDGSVGNGLLFRHGLHVVATTGGLWLIPIVLFRPSHLPLHIPWDALTSVWEEQRGGRHMTAFQTQACPDLPIMIPTQVIETAQKWLPALGLAQPRPKRRHHILLPWLVIMVPSLLWLTLVSILLNQGV